MRVHLGSAWKAILFFEPPYSVELLTADENIEKACRGSYTEQIGSHKIDHTMVPSGAFYTYSERTGPSFNNLNT